MTKSDASPCSPTVDGSAPSGSDHAERLQLADAHDRQAVLYDRFAAAAAGLLFFGFLHAAEAHRAAARLSRSSTGTH